MKDPLIVYGRQVVKILLEQDTSRVATLVVSDKKVSGDMHSMARRNGVRVEKMPPAKMDQLAQQGLHQGVIAYLKGWPYADEKDLFEIAKNDDSSNLLILVLDGIQDPHNLGACLRTAEAAGASAVVIPKDNSSKLNSVVAKVSCGAIFTVPIFRVTNISRVMKKLQALGVWFIGTDLDATSSIDDIQCTGNTGIVLGSEGEGLRDLTKKHCDHLIKLPMLGHVESLNVSVSAGVCLYEVLRQRRMKV